MRKFKYVGDPNDRYSGPDEIESNGFSFVKGEVTEIEDKDGKNADAIRRLEGNSHFIDMSDREAAKKVDDEQKAFEKAEADKAKKAEDQRKADEKDAAEREKRRKANPESPAATAPRPPGTVTRETPDGPFGGRTVEERTRAEDHTSAGKTKS